jgi:hypothetical protein
MQRPSGRKSIWLVPLIGALLLAVAGLAPAAALAGGGTSIGAAPLVTYGMQEFGNTAEGQHLEDSCGFLVGAWRSYWQLPVLAGDRITINWEGTHGTRLILTPVGTTDFTYLTTDPAYYQDLSSNGKAEAQYSAPLSGSMPLTFRVCEYYEEEPGPYDFVAVDQHALSAALTPTSNIYRHSALGGTASLMDGTPAPDGLVFHLVAKWHSGGQLLRWATAATSAGGGLGFQLALPAETNGKTVRLSVSRGEDASYLAATSSPLLVHVAGRHRHHRHHHHRGRA